MFLFKFNMLNQRPSLANKDLPSNETKLNKHFSAMLNFGTVFLFVASTQQKPDFLFSFNLIQACTCL